MVELNVACTVLTCKIYYIGNIKDEVNMINKVFGVVLGLAVLGSSGVLAEDERFNTTVDGGGSIDWSNSVQTAEPDPQLGSPVGKSVGGTGSVTSLSPMTIQAISAEMPQGAAEVDVTYKQRTVATYGHGSRVVVRQSDITEYRTCKQVITYRDSYVNGQKVGSETVSTQYGSFSGWSTSSAYRSGTYFSKCSA